MTQQQDDDRLPRLERHAGELVYVQLGHEGPIDDSLNGWQGCRRCYTDPREMPECHWELHFLETLGQNLLIVVALAAAAQAARHAQILAAIQGKPQTDLLGFSSHEE